MSQEAIPNVYNFPFGECGIQGRWPSPDPLGPGAFDLADPQSLDRYAYVRNSPTSSTDPSGLLACRGGRCPSWLTGGGGGGLDFNCIWDGVICGIFTGDELLSTGAVGICPTVECGAWATDKKTGKKVYVEYFCGAGGACGYWQPQERFELIEADGQLMTPDQFQAYEAVKVFALFAQVLKTLGINVSSITVRAWTSGLFNTLNIQLRGIVLSPGQLGSLLDASFVKDLLTFNHGGDTSFLQLFDLFSAGHFVADALGVEFHVDPFGALNPAHWPDFAFGIFGQTWNGSYTCTATGCH
jgi:hypothetical protein